MRALALSLVALQLWAGASSDWAEVERLRAGAKVLAIPRKSGVGDARGSIVRSNAEGLVIATKNGEVSLQRDEVKLVKVEDPSRRTRNGLLGLAIGGAGGAAAGGLACPYCPNEGHGYGFVFVGMALGLGLGALAFLPTPYRTVYKAAKRK